MKKPTIKKGWANAIFKTEPLKNLVFWTDKSHRLEVPIIVVFGERGETQKSLMRRIDLFNWRK